MNFMKFYVGLQILLGPSYDLFWAESQFVLASKEG